MRPRRSLRSVLSTAIPWVVLLLMVGLMGLVIFPLSHPATAPVMLAPDLTTIDPQSLVPTLSDFPRGTTLSTFNYVSTEQASRRNGVPLTLLRQTGREIGYDRDFLVPQYGDIEIETVRFRTHSGMASAYTYFRTMIPGGTVPAPVSVRGVGERSTLALLEGGGFMEFMRGRYYVVITAVPATREAVGFIEGLARTVDRRIRSYSSNA